MHNPSTICSARLPALLFALLFGLPGIVAADKDADPYYEYRDEIERGEFSYDDSQDIPWIENETEVLASPREEDLVRVAIDQMPPGMSLFIDSRRLTMNPADRVIRLWLVVRSEAGVDNGSFEGFRCATREYKVYAYSNPSRTPPVTKAKRPRWRSISRLRSSNYRLELLQDYFCSHGRARSANEIRLALNDEIERDTFFTN